MRALCIVVLALLPTACLANGWDVQTYTDRMTDKRVTVASVRAGDAELVVTCHSTGPKIIFDRPVAAYELGMKYRFDTRPVVQRMVHVASDYHTVYPWLTTAADARREIARSKRFRVKIFPKGFYDFDLTGSREAIAKLGCR